MDPQFGIPSPGHIHADRPAAFGLALREGLLALAHVRTPQGEWFDLPGGAIDPGEDAPAALVREFGEETGLIVAAGSQVARASQYFRLGDGRPVNNRLSVFIAPILGADPALKIEADHTLVWRTPLEALSLLRHDAHAWGVTAWLRSRGSAPVRSGELP